MGRNVSGTVRIPKEGVQLTEDQLRQSFKGKRVGVIGSGSSAIQIIPAIQKTKGIQITNFVRSKAWISRPFADNAMEPLGLQNVECKDVSDLFPPNHWALHHI